MSIVHSPAIWTQPGIYSVEQFQAALEREKARAERNGHSVSLVTIQTDGRQTRERPRLEDVLKARLRIMDEAGWFDQSRIGVLMPYTSPQGAWHMVEDVCRLMQGALSPSDCRVYTYPQDWFGGDELRREQEGIAAEEAQPAGANAENPIDVPCGQGVSDGRRSSGYSDGTADAAPGACPFESRSRIAAPTWQRGLDILGSSLGLAVLSPLLLVTALVIKLVSPGPVFFRQVRIGRGGMPFRLWKFRTMKADADTSIHRNHVAQLIRSANEDGGGQAHDETGQGILG